MEVPGQIPWENLFSNEFYVEKAENPRALSYLPGARSAVTGRSVRELSHQARLRGVLTASARDFANAPTRAGMAATAPICPTNRTMALPTITPSA